MRARIGRREKDRCRQRIEYDTNLVSVTRAHSRPVFVFSRCFCSHRNEENKFQWKISVVHANRLITIGCYYYYYYSVYFIGTGCISSGILIIFSRYGRSHELRVKSNTNTIAHTVSYFHKYTHTQNFVVKTKYIQTYKRIHSVPCLLTNSPAEYLISGDNNENHCANYNVCRCVSFVTAPGNNNNHYYYYCKATQRNENNCLCTSLGQSCWWVMSGSTFMGASK